MCEQFLFNFNVGVDSDGQVKSMLLTDSGLCIDNPRVRQSEGSIIRHKF